ncbi:MAG TPA: MASE1 domain-containing protein, partial [Luteimonas sp.]|nr:MASE1 domain-containing protein [Luteimonas sp.]
MTTAPEPAGAPARPWFGLVALALLTFASCWFAFRLTRFDGVTSLWVVNGLLTGTLLLTPKSQWRDWMLSGALGQILARLLIGDSWLQIVGLGAINLLECGIVAYWVRRHVTNLRNAPSLGVVSRDAFTSTLVACLISATLALPITLTRSGVVALPAWGSWFSAHVLGMVIFATLTVCAFQRRVRLFGARGRRRDFAACVALLLLVCALAFGQERYSLLFLVYLPFLLLAFRH